MQGVRIAGMIEIVKQHTGTKSLHVFLRMIMSMWWLQDSSLFAGDQFPTV